MDEILAGYAVAATPELIARFEALSSREVYAPILNLLPTTPVSVADIGAGTGRDAMWFAAQGHRVLAVEPVKELREAGIALHDCPMIEWLDDRLPQLVETRARGPFDLVTLSAVWQHLDDNARQLAMPNLEQITVPGGMVIMSLRHGPGAPGRRVFPVSPEESIYAARRSGFQLLLRSEANSIQAENQASGVRWTWLVLKKVC
ncbi:class I SAM-dependent methyltransferase [Novosphingobium resinovorum]|jgi:SAM-dependent methyltransferase|uniref:class I SAM-dependent methyltransferase n=1 Tax=Novosphingobium resinovorum TaxID=158500 RepID=UPI00055DBF50|nr:class I SAM-dependent methyltransferase [Novosphingobium resinovorum]